MTRALTKVTIHKGSLIYTSKARILCSCAPGHHLSINGLACTVRHQRRLEKYNERTVVLQNRYLRVVAGAYKATSVELLHAETNSADARILELLAA